MAGFYLALTDRVGRNWQTRHFSSPAEGGAGPPSPCYDPALRRSEPKIRNSKSRIGRHRPKLGQHFLHDQQYRTRILEELPLLAGDVVIEIGPGRGAMTALLAARARKVIAIEVDALLAQRLQEDFRGQPVVQIILADV